MPHPGNILIRSTPAGWVCADIIDWEFARVGDPWWDVTRFDFRPAGLVPPAFYEGYGSRPSDAMAGIYDLIHALWRADAIVRNGQDFGGWPPTDAVLAYVRALDQHLPKLQSLL